MRTTPSAVLLALLFAAGCSKPDPVRQALIGHWHQVSSSRVPGPDPRGLEPVQSAASPGLHAAETASATDLYYSESAVWTVASGALPVKQEYSLSNIDPQGFSFTQHIGTPSTGTVSSDVTFSADRQQMQATLASVSPMGSAILTIVYQRVDDRTAPQ